MATTGNYYIDTNSFDTATSIYTDEGLTIIAPDGYYQFAGNYRQQVGGLLLPAKTCPSCIPVVPCNESVSSGGVGVTEYSIILDNPEGGLVVFEFNAQSVPDKAEIIHNGTKKATSGMTTPNEGPFDDLYGDPTIPTTVQANATDQFIGTSKGTIPTRQSEFTTETGSALTIEAGFQQLVWWQYSSIDYNLNQNVVFRVTGPSGTAWNFKRLCDPINTIYYELAGCDPADYAFTTITPTLGTGQRYVLPSGTPIFYTWTGSSVEQSTPPTEYNGSIQITEFINCP